MIPSDLSPDNIRTILNKIQPYINKTPFIKASTKLDEFFSTNLYFKCEFLQKSGSFKARGAAGFALGGPIGAILGVMAGGAFDRRSKSRSSFNFNRIDNDQKQQIFTLSFIILSAKLAKSDGQVTDDEIRAFKEKFKVPKSEMSKVAKIFNEAKKDTYGYKQIANQVGNLFSNNKILLEE